MILPVPRQDGYTVVMYSSNSDHDAHILCILFSIPIHPRISILNRGPEPVMGWPS